MTFGPNTLCPNAYLSQKKGIVPNAKSPNYILSQKPLLEISSNTSNSHLIFDQQGNSASFDAGNSVPKWIVPMTSAQ